MDKKPVVRRRLATDPEPTASARIPSRVGRGRFAPLRHSVPIFRDLAQAAAAIDLHELRGRVHREGLAIVDGERVGSRHSIIARLGGVHRSTVAKLLSGRSIDVESATKIARVLGLALGWMPATKIEADDA